MQTYAMIHGAEVALSRAMITDTLTPSPGGTRHDSKYVVRLPGCSSRSIAGTAAGCTTVVVPGSGDKDSGGFARRTRSPHENLDVEQFIATPLGIPRMWAIPTLLEGTANTDHCI